MQPDSRSYIRGSRLTPGFILEAGLLIVAHAQSARSGVVMLPATASTAIWCHIVSQLSGDAGIIVAYSVTKQTVQRGIKRETGGYI